MSSLMLVISILFFLAPSLGILRADTVILKSGETVSGKIIKEEVGEITVEYKVSASITDQKTIPRIEVEKIQKEALDEVAYTNIRGYKTDPEWSMQADRYQRMIPPLNDFLARFPQSAHAAEVKHNLDSLSAERDRVVGGEMKLFGNWLTKEQAQKQQLQSQAQAAFSSMRDRAMQGDYIGALNLFEGIKTNNKGALVYPSAIQLAAAVMQNLQRQTAQQRQAILSEEENWKNTIAMTTEPQKSQYIASRAQIASQAELALAAAQKSGLKWNPGIAHSLKSLEEIDRTLTAEKAALAALPVTKMRESIALTNKASDAVAAHKVTEAEALLKDAKTLWTENGAVEYLTSEIASIKAAATPTPAELKTEPVKVVKKPAVAVAPAPAPVVEEEPFYKTPTGAAAIVVTLLLAIGLGTLAMRLVNKPKERAA